MANKKANKKALVNYLAKFTFEQVDYKTDGVTYESFTFYSTKHNLSVYIEYNRDFGYYEIFDCKMLDCNTVIDESIKSTGLKTNVIPQFKSVFNDWFVRTIIEQYKLSY